MLISKKANRQYYLFKRLRKIISKRVKKRVFLYKNVSFDKYQIRYIVELKREYGYSFELDRIKRTKRDNRKYYLHQCIKRLIRKRIEKTIFISHSANITAKEHFYLSELRNKFGYSVQNEI